MGGNVLAHTCIRASLAKVFGQSISEEGRAHAKALKWKRTCVQEPDRKLAYLFSKAAVTNNHRLSGLKVTDTHSVIVLEVRSLKSSCRRNPHMYSVVLP